MMKRKFVSAFLVASVTVVFIVCPVFGGLSYVDDMTMAFPGTWFYDGTAKSFGINSATIVTGDILADGSYDYSFDGTITVTECDLLSDSSSGGIARGEFAGSATLTIVGDIKDDLSNVLASGVTILQAQMDPTSWLIQEASVRTVDGTNYFTPTGGLGNGIDLSDGTTLKIGQFRGDFSFQNVQPIDPAFFDGAPNLLGIASNLQITAIPEPCTMGLLAFGGLLLRRKK